MKNCLLCTVCGVAMLLSGLTFAAEVGDLQGVWAVSTTQGESVVETKMYMRVVKGKLRAAVLAMVEGGAVQRAGASAVTLEGDELTWKVPVPYITEDGATVTVTVSEGSFEGVVATSLGETSITGVLTETPLPMQVDPSDVAYLLGYWDVKALIGESESEGWVTIELSDGSLFGTLASGMGIFTSDNVEYDKTGDTSGTVLLHVAIPGTIQTMEFKLDIDGDTFEGEELNSNGMFKVSGTKVKLVVSEPVDDEPADDEE